MTSIKKRVGVNGSIVIREVLNMAKIRPGDWVKITPLNNKVIIETAKQKKPKGAVKAAAGILKDNDSLVDEMLRIREIEDDRPENYL
jgi:hypothetical protein